MTARPKKLFVLDTNVLMHDSTALYRFHEHDIFLPMTVLEELDRNKSGQSEAARNARQASRFIHRALENGSRELGGKGNLDLAKGLPLYTELKECSEEPACSGRLFFETTPYTPQVKNALAGEINDNKILNVARALKEQFGDAVILVSKDINLRIKAAIVGVEAEDYFNDQVLDDADLLTDGFLQYEGDFWDHFQGDLTSWVNEEGIIHYKVSGEEVAKWVPNQALFIKDELDYIVKFNHPRLQHRGNTAFMERPFSDVGRRKEAVLQALKDYTERKISGISARNQGQNFAFNIMLDPDIDFVTLLGGAGTGKTLLALAAGLHEVLENKRFDQIIMTRAAVAVGDSIGFLPGTEEEKMAPWMGALMDNLEVLLQSRGDEKRRSVKELLNHHVKIKSLNFMRGRTFQNKWIIIDEAQNITSKQMKTLITRAGPNTKVLCLGNIGQIDTPYLTETTSGLTYVVEKFQRWEHAAHITLQTGERSRLAAYASDYL